MSKISLVQIATCTRSILALAVKLTFFGAGDVSGARLLNEVTHALADEIAALDKKIAAKP